MKGRAKLPDGIDQGLQVVRVYIGGNAVAQVEYVPGPVAKAAEYLAGFVSNHCGGRQQNCRVHVALQGNSLPDPGASLGQ